MGRLSGEVKNGSLRVIYILEDEGSVRDERSEMVEKVRGLVVL